MHALAPGSWFRQNSKQNALIIVIDGWKAGDDGYGKTLNGYILLRRGGQEIPVGSLDLDSPGIVGQKLRFATGLRLPCETVLSRRLVLPLAAARDLQTMIGFEIDRLTPFAADELYWSVSSLKRDRAGGKLSLQLSFVLRAEVEALRQALSRLLLVPSFIECKTGRIDLKAKSTRANRLLQVGLSALCCLLALACLASPFMRQQIELDAAARSIAEHAPAAKKALALRQQLSTAAYGRIAIAQAQRNGDALWVLATLTQALPDGTWLSGLTLKSGDLTVDGKSSDVAQLIGLIAAYPGLHDPSFTAPVTHTVNGTADQFSLHVWASK